jgi:hypothetical protein
MRTRHSSLPFFCLLVAAVALPARPCGPDFPYAVFVLPNGPGLNYAAYAAGHLGVPQPGYFTRSLVVAYEWMTGHALNVGEQQQAVSANALFVHEYDDSDPRRQAPPTGFGAWLKARASFGPVGGPVDGPVRGFVPDATLATDRSVPGENYESFTNCLDDAFANAAATLSARITAHGAKDPGVVEWVRGQDAVFSNCGDGKAPEYFGPGKPPPPPAQPYSPKVLTGAPQWLTEDRIYQLAAGQFYAMQYDAAAASFRAIAADNASPWQPLSGYLVARALLRKASIGSVETLHASDQQNVTQQQRIADQKAAKIAYQNELTAARAQLISLDAQAGHAALKPAIEGLTDYINLRLEPQEQAQVLAKRLNAGDGSRYRQDLIDLTYLRTGDDGGDLPLTQPPSGSSGLLAWMLAMNNQDGKGAFALWQATQTTPWLVAALTLAEAHGPATPALLEAAAKIPASDPAYVALMYQRLRLLAPGDATRAELERTLPQVTTHESLSTKNLFASLSTANAPSLEMWLATAGRVPPAQSDDMDPGPTYTLAPGTAPSENPCGTKVPAAEYKLFDTDAAFALNHNFPLTELATAAESSVLPQNLRYQIAQAAWVRAVLLDQPAIAHRMTPLLIDCRAAWKPVLDAYDSATTADARHAAGLLALMRFASTEPSVRDGVERRNGFAAYDQYRQNWWCTTVPAAHQTVDELPAVKGAADTSGADGSQFRTIHPSQPLFLTAAQIAAAQQEVAALEKFPDATEYFGREALAWQKSHPHDPQTPDLLGEAFRVQRNSCATEAASSTGHALFDILHQQYPQSEWTRRYTTWE